MAYNQIPVKEHDKQKSAFGTPRGGFFKNLCNCILVMQCSETFYRNIELAVTGLKWNTTFLFQSI